MAAIRLTSSLLIVKVQQPQSTGQITEDTAPEPLPGGKAHAHK